MIRELDQRHNDGIAVTLLWNQETNRVFVSVVDARKGVSFEFEVAGADAADAFHHPYAYAGPAQQSRLVKVNDSVE
jgi:hypothetical protein